MKYLLMLIATSCTSYHVGTIIGKSKHVPSVECIITPNYYILPSISVNEWDTLEVGDTVHIDKKNLKLVDKK